jgi:Family of unknown function (DUF6494)
VDEETFNLSIRKFLKKLGVTAQREIELGVRDRILPARAVITVEGLERPIEIDGRITLAAEAGEPD